MATSHLDELPEVSFKGLFQRRRHSCTRDRDSGVIMPSFLPNAEVLAITKGLEKADYVIS